MLTVERDDLKLVNFKIFNYVMTIIILLGKRKWPLTIKCWSSVVLVGRARVFNDNHGYIMFFTTGRGDALSRVPLLRTS